jgi:hypothetical protein
MIKEAYEKLKKEHPVLPEFDKMNKEFEIELLESDKFLLRHIKRKISEKMEPVLDLLEHSINPDPNSFSDMYECRCFTNGEKKQVIDIFRHLMENYRSLLETDLMGEDKKDAETIRKIYDIWQQDKKQLLPLLKKIRECWQKHVEPKEILEYLG